MENKGAGGSAAERDLFAESLGMVIEQAAPGHAVCSVRLGPQHCNGLGRVQGGLIFTLADYAFAAAANNAGHTTVSLTSTITFLRPPEGALLRAEARARREGGRVGYYQVSVTDEQNRLVAEVVVTGFHLAPEGGAAR